MLADLVRVGYLPKVWLAPEDVRQLRTLVRHRQQLVNERRATKLRVAALLRENRVDAGKLRRWTRAWLAWLPAAAGLGSEGLWVVNRHLASLNRLAKEIAEVELRLAQVTEEDCAKKLGKGESL